MAESAATVQRASSGSEPAPAQPFQTRRKSRWLLYAAISAVALVALGGVTMTGILVIRAAASRVLEARSSSSSEARVESPVYSTAEEPATLPAVPGPSTNHQPRETGLHEPPPDDAASGFVEEYASREPRPGSPPTEEVRQLIARLVHAESSERISAAMDLATYGEAALPAVPALTRMLGDPDAGARMAAAVAIGGVGASPGTGEAAPALVNALRDQSAVVRIEAARALGLIDLFGPEMASVIPHLRAALVDEDPRVRNVAAETLDALGQ